MPDNNFNIIRIVSPQGMEEKEADTIACAFAERYKLSNFELRQEKDPALLGGFVVFIAGKRYDYSLKGRLSQIAGTLGEGTGGDIQSTDDALANLKSTLQQKRQEMDERSKNEEKLGFLWEIEPVDVTDGEKTEDIHLLMDEYLNSIRNGIGFSGNLVDEVGEVLSVGDGIAYVSGLENCMNGELLVFSPRTYGMAMNLEPKRVGVVLLGDIEEVSEGSVCKRSASTISVPAGEAMLGRIVDALGKAIDGQGAISRATLYPIEAQAPSVIDRQPVTQPLYTGITAIDAMTPIGRGQRELIIGDRQTGKTALTIDTILNQKATGIRCVYVAIGQKMSTVAATVQILRSYGAMEYTTVVVASASDQASMQYLAPYTGCAIAESWMRLEHKDVLVIYDDLTKHAQAYRAISLLLRRPPGREAFPGDVFYLHSRLLERACRLSDEAGGGSITAIPVVETQAGDIAAYIPTNVISITDGQIYLETALFFSGQRPAINVGLSVSRVGGAAQTKAMKKVAGALRINLAQYKEIAAFSQFGSELDAETREQIARGASLNEVLVQTQYKPRTMAESVSLLFLANEGLLSEIPTDDVRFFGQAFLLFLRSGYQNILNDIEESGLFETPVKERLQQAYRDFLPQWKKSQDADEAEV